MLMIKETTCAFTGHRPESFVFGDNEDHPECIRIKERLTEEILKMAQNGVDTFISGAARGVDMWAMEAVVEVKKKLPHLQLIAAIPYTDQPKSWSEAEYARYCYLLGRCEDFDILSPKYYRGCLHARNRYMVDNSAHLIAVYNGSKKGGTAYTVKYASKRGRNIVIIDV